MTRLMMMVMPSLVSAVVWVALWGDPTVPNLVVGAALPVPFVVTGRLRSRPVKLVPAARLAAMILVDLVRSTASVAWHVVRPDPAQEEGLIEVGLPPAARDILLLLACAITITPGTAVVSARHDGAVPSLRLHLLRRDKADDVRKHVQRLTEVALLALPRHPSAGVSP